MADRFWLLVAGSFVVTLPRYSALLAAGSFAKIMLTAGYWQKIFAGRSLCSLRWSWLYATSLDARVARFGKIKTLEPLKPLDFRQNHAEMTGVGVLSAVS